MAGFSKYPDQIDDSSTLPVSTDNVTPVKSEVVNRLRDAILAIEAELGIDPSREFGTVRARLDSINGGGGGGAIEILQNGIEVLPSAISLDFIGNVSVSISSPLKATVQITGGQATQIQESLIPAFNGATIFNLSHTPFQTAAVMMFINGIKQQQGVDYSILGTSVTYTGGTSLRISDSLEFWYIIDAGGSIVNTVPSGSSGGDLGGTYPNPTVLRVTPQVVNISSGPYNVTNSDYLLAIDTTSNAVTVNLLSSPVLGKSIEIKDVNGNANINNITINGNGHNIDGSSILLLNVAFESFTLRFTGNQWSIV